jgi:phosphoserine phosphatase
MDERGWLVPGAAKRDRVVCFHVARTAGGILALACTKSNTLLWARMMNPMISKEGVSLMLLSQLPRSLHDWSGALSCAPCWQLTNEALLPAASA